MKTDNTCSISCSSQYRPEEKQITKEQFAKINKYRVVVIHKWFFWRLYDNIFEDEPDSTRFKFIKML